MRTLSQSRAFYEENGYTVISGLFTDEEVAFFQDHFTALNERNRPGDAEKQTPPTEPDPLLLYPRMIQMHRWDKPSLDWMLDKRLNACLTALLGREPLALQTMFYFKPPGARGQALHQDNFYLKARPGTCMAAWMALDPCDDANGCLQIVPGSQDWPILCTTKADTTKSFTDITVPIPEGQEIVSIIMEPGDVLFFNGSLVHGSLPNVTKDRFRRALIAHYVEGDSTHVFAYDRPILRMDGTEAEIVQSEQGGKCGEWVDTGGRKIIEMTGNELAHRKHE